MRPAIASTSECRRYRLEERARSKGDPPAVWLHFTVGGPRALDGLPDAACVRAGSVLFGVYVRVGVPTVSGIS
jgi:hypothetical protein